ncbi:MAG: nucleotidyltransferase family protein [Deltaproteobacteria bacterium]|jgi:molybdenum cofactor cytidylyltransferase|nr:nucleotidyltransferase family protein [Deltaproteobacteria bacterium]
MKISNNNISGLILAAGASTRMGTHKALLEIGVGQTLLSHQTALLLESGCSNVTVVLGAVTEDVIKQHPELLVKWAINDEWEIGQFSSLKAGLHDAMRDNPGGIIILPIDTVGVKAETICAITETALRNPHLKAVVPEHEGRGGHPIYISKALAMELLVLDPGKPDSRLDIVLQDEFDQMRLPVNDSGVITNINTPDDWERYKI